MKLTKLSILETKQSKCKTANFLEIFNQIVLKIFVQIFVEVLIFCQKSKNIFDNLLELQSTPDNSFANLLGTNKFGMSHLARLLMFS